VVAEVVAQEAQEELQRLVVATVPDVVHVLVQLQEPLIQVAEVVLAEVVRLLLMELLAAKE
jgi:hypothetical protein